MKLSGTFALTSVLESLPAGAWAQAALDMGALAAIDDAEVVTTDGTEVGEIDDVLIDPAGTPMAVVVEVDGLLGVDDQDVVFALSELTFAEGNYITALSETEIEGLPRHDSD